ncbi:RNA methyltransferase [Pueribacillus theae]|uniref:RNA methyltransferase n=1 Tax=Pueribacillus theae TaxID=2171751 RepID=A0A2U1JVD3_9BACI|nr:class I SAM-dependent RNA methyltransferase [Pueribacillus theae]PWA08894.1 RNA methyltransferase [Pueribacillus theae]
MNKFTLIATAAMGIEALVAREVRNLGFENIQVENGKITYDSDALGICRSNMWLRTADRVKLKIGEFRATSYEELFEQTKALPWGDILPEDAEFPVIGKSVKSKLYSVPDCQSIVKKAIVEGLKERYHVTWFKETGPLFRIEIALHKDIATLSIDTSGTGLHKRGYRYLHNTAPLKETLAAAMIMLANWKYDQPFVDPFCGSGTIPIEAAMIGQNIAPGFNRNFACENWPIISPENWRRAEEEAEDLAKYDRKLDIIGSDIDHKMVDLSKNNAAEAGLSELIEFKQMQVADFNPSKEHGVVVCNPPYGERIGEKEKVEQLYRSMGAAFKRFPSWSVYVITSNEDFEKLYGKKASKKRKLYNGNIKTDYYQFFGLRGKNN